MTHFCVVLQCRREYTHRLTSYTLPLNWAINHKASVQLSNCDYLSVDVLHTECMRKYHTLSILMLGDTHVDVLFKVNDKLLCILYALMLVLHHVNVEVYKMLPKLAPDASFQLRLLFIY